MSQKSPELKASKSSVFTGKYHSNYRVLRSEYYSIHQIKCDRYLELINNHKHRFIMDGEFNVKKGQRVIKSSSTDWVQYNVYWDTNLLANRSTWNTRSYWFIHYQTYLFKLYAHRKCLDIVLDHSPIYLTLHEKVVKEPPFTLTNKNTD